MTRKIMFVINPIAGKGNVSSIILPVIDSFSKLGDEVSVFTTQFIGHATSYIQELSSNYDIVVASGGDGTLNEIVCGLMKLKKRPKLCFIPNGTVNDFANSLGLKKSEKFIHELIQKNYMMQIDVGKFNQEYFTYVAAFGAFTKISYSTPQQSKNIFGKAAYFFEGFKSLNDIKSYTLIIESDDQNIEGEFVFGVISNSKSIAGLQFKSTKEAKLDDGLFEVLLIKEPQNPLDLQNIIGALLTQNINDHLMYYFKTSKLVIHSVEKIAWTLDGEKAKPSNRIQILNKNKAIDIFVLPEK